MKNTSFVIVLLLCLSFLHGEDDKVQAIIKKTHASVQKLLKDESVHPRKRKIRIIQAVKRGERALNALRRHFVLRHAFAEAKKIKVSMAAFKKIDFSKKDLNGAADVAKAQPAKGGAKPGRLARKNKGGKASFYLGLQGFHKMSPAEKESIIRKVVKSDENGLLKLSSDHFTIHTDYSSYKLVQMAIELEWIADVYGQVFNSSHKKLVKKATFFVMKKREKLEAILAKKNIRFNTSSSRYDVKTHCYYRSNGGSSFRHSRSEVFKIMGHSYGSPISSRHSYYLLKPFRGGRMFASMESLQMESLFGYSTSLKHFQRAKDLLRNYKKFTDKLVSSRHLISSDFLSMFTVFLFYNGNFKDIELLAAEGHNFFKKPKAKVLLEDFELFFKTEVPLSADFCGSLVRKLWYKSYGYSNELENDDKLIIVNAKYKGYPQAFYFKALHAYHSKKYDKTIEFLLKIKGGAARYPFYESLLARSYLKLNNMAKAVQHKKRALKVCPNDLIVSLYLKDLK